MNKAHYRAAAAVLTAAMAASVLTGCANNGGGGGKSIIGGGKKGSTLEVSLDHSYASEKVTVGNTTQVGDFVEIGEKLLIVSYDEKYDEKFILFDPNSGESKEVKLQGLEQKPEGGDSYPQGIVNYQDGIGVIFSAYKWENEGTEEEEYIDLGYTLEIYDADMNLKETKDLGTSEDGFNFNEVFSLPGGGFIATGWDNNTGDSKLFLLDDDLKETGTISGDMQYVNNIVVMKDGTVAANYQDKDGNASFGTIDVNARTLTKTEIEGAPQWYDTVIPSASEDYSFYLKDSTSLYGVKLGENKCEEVINWVNSDFMGDYVGNVKQLSDGRFLIVSNSSNYDSAELWALTPRDPSELENVKLISCSTIYTDDTLAQAVNQFNRTNGEYRIVLYNYQQFMTDDENGYQVAIDKFNNDMTSGVVADIICTDSLDFESLANKGVFLDLTDKTSQLSSDEYFTNVFNAYAYGGKQYRIPFSFSVSTMEAKSKYVGDKGGLTVKEYTDLITNLPSGMKPFSEDMTRDAALSTHVMTNLNAFTDVSNGTCSFNTPEFVELLEFCNTFPEETGAYDEKSDAEWEKYWAEEQYQYINDKTLLRRVWLSNVKDLYRERFTYFGDKDAVTFVGYPTSGNGSNGGLMNTGLTLAISSNSAYQDVCWDFLNMILGEDFQEKLNWQIPVRKEAFDKKIEQDSQPQTYTDEDGNEVRYDDTIWRGDEEIKIPDMPQEFIDMVKDYISNVTESNYYDEKLSNIITEEASMYFTGDQTAQQAADMIQSRAALYLSEQH